MISIASFGDKLRAERERQGYTLAQVSHETKIRQHYLAALENEDFESLPARVYSIGFVASYARFLKIDADRLVNEFKSLAYTSPPFEAPPPEPVSGTAFGFPVRNVLAAALFLVVALWLGNYVADFITQRSINPPPQVQQPAPPGVPDNQTATPEQLTLAILATERSWVQVTVDGAVQFVGTMEPGDSKTFTAADMIQLRTGNAGGIELRLNGDPVAGLGASGQIADKTFTRISTGLESPAVTALSTGESPHTQLNLVVQAKQISWVQIEADGEVVYARTMAKDESQSFTAAERIELRTGNAGGIILILNGQPVNSLGSPGQIAEKKFYIDGRAE